MVIFPVSECAIIIEILKLSYWFPDPWSEGKAKWKHVEFLLQRKLVNQNQYRTPGRSADMRATIKDLKDAAVVGSTYLLLTSPAEDGWMVKNDS